MPCPGKNCLNCKVPDHVARVCRQHIQSNSAQALIASVEYDQNSDTFTTPTTVTSIEEIPGILFSSLLRHKHISPVKINIFSDSGASICLSGPESQNPTLQGTRACPPPRPEKLPYPPLEENIPKLEQYLRHKFRDTAFNRTSPFPPQLILCGLLQAE